MINGSYFRTDPSRQTRPVPVQKGHRNSSPEVVSVPAHFFPSKQPQMSSSVSKQSAALKIQRVFRGFLVRKSVKKISSIRFEVREVEKTINDAETVQLIRIDAKERLRVNETLMSLLFKLDSIRGVDFGVRDFRKAVINKAIALQEKIDSIVADNNGSEEIGSENDFKITSVHVPESSVFCDEVVDTDSVMNADSLIDLSTEGLKEIDVNCNPDSIATDKNASETGCKFTSVHVPESYLFRDEVVDTDSVMNADGVIDLTMGVLQEIDVSCNPEKGETDNKKRNLLLIEKLMDDNEKMMTLLTQMFERNEMQTRMLNSLSQRVEQLEKGLVCDKSRKKKKYQCS